MLVFYGHGQGQSVVGEEGQNVCPACGEESTFKTIVQYTYFHIWWLFSFVTGRTYHLVCDKCQASAPVDAHVVREKYTADNIPFIRRRGWMLVAGAILFFVAWGAVSSHFSKQQMEGYLEAPQMNDLYLANLAFVDGSGFTGTDVKLPMGKRFGTLLLVEIDGDDLAFATSMMAISEKKELRRWVRNESESKAVDMENLVYLTHDEVRELYKKGTIIEVQRGVR